MEAPVSFVTPFLLAASLQSSSLLLGTVSLHCMGEKGAAT
jgi:hypothetical protein